MSTPYDLELPLPEGWVEIAPDARHGLEGWARRVAADAAADASEDQRQALAEHLAAVAADSARRTPLLAALLLDPGPGPVAVVLEGWSLQPDPGASLDLATIVEQQRAALDHVVLEPDVEIVELPPGPAVRVHRVLVGEPQESLRRSVVEEVTHIVLPPSLPADGLVLTATWQNLALGDHYAALVDEVVRGLHMAPRQTGS